MRGAAGARGKRLDPDDEMSLATRAAWLYHAGGLTQSEVAVRLKIANVKAHRLIARATRAGLVRVFVDGPIGGCIGLEERLAARFGLRVCRVVPGIDSMPRGGLPLGALGQAAASFLCGVLERAEHSIIGVGHGRTLAAAIDHLPRIATPKVRFVSLLGGLPRWMSSNAFEVIHRLAEKTGGEAWLLPVPFFANTAADRTVLLRQRGIAEALEVASRATLCLAGVGEVVGDALLIAAGMVSAEEAAAAQAAGAVGELLGHYFDADGRLVATPLHERVVALPPASWGGRDLVAVAGGPSKVAALRAVLNSRLVSGLITDEQTARRLVGPEPARASKEREPPCTRKPKTSAMPSRLAGSAAAS